MATDFTHDAGSTSWLESARAPESDFPVQNLPLGIFRPRGSGEAPRPGVAIGDQVLDLARSLELELLPELSSALASALTETTLNGLMSLGAGASRSLRESLFRLLSSDAAEAVQQQVRRALVPQDEAEMLMPAQVGDYTDFYCSIHHAKNVGSMFRPDNPLMPNYKHLPVGYHGRASSLVASGTPVRRPLGQTKADQASGPSFGPSRLLDYELEVGFFVGAGNTLGESVPLAQAEDQLFGFCLVNDWSARDLQKWEYQPLGPFLGKSFATSLSPWVVTRDALAPFRVPAEERAEEDPQPLPYLDCQRNRTAGGVDLRLEVYLSTVEMRERKLAPHRLSHGSFRHMYWTAAQMLTHHASNGCNLRPGDLMASGTVSGPDKENRGCLLELTWRGAEPLQLPSGEERRFLQDGDEVILRGWCEAPGAVRIGFGECRGQVLPAPE